jgi:hypothetical protein
MRIVERPDFTSYFPDFAFHLIKDEEEAKNVNMLLGDKKPFVVMRSVDTETFQPMLFFAIPEDNKPFSDWLKYVTRLELMVTKND